MSSDRDLKNEARELRDRFRLDKRPIGTGGFAQVFAAEEKDTGRVVAFKRLQVRDAEAKRRFQREIRVQRSMTHRHVMSVLDADPLGLWYTMPLADGSLESLAPVLSPDEVSSAIRDAGAGLAEGHLRQLTHRDVTPRNILRVRDGGASRWVMADWGLVRLPSGKSGSMKTVGALGTARFIAPELNQDARAATVRSDLYSLGMVAKVICELRGWGGEAGFDRFIRACTKPDPQARPSSVAEALLLLSWKGPAHVPTYLVWHEGSDGAANTLLVQCESDRANVIGKRPGKYVCDGERLMEWRHSSHEIEVPDWDSLDRDRYVATRHKRITIKDAMLLDYDTGNTVRVSPVEPRERADDFTFDIERNTRLVGSLGPFLFVTEQVWAFTGGAHGNTGARFNVIDARTGLPVEALSPSEFETHFDRERAVAIEAHRTNEHVTSGWLTEQKLQEASLTQYRPVLDGTGHPAIEAQITFGASFAASDGRWSSYSESERIVSERVPEPLEALASLPPPIATLVQQPTPPECVGWR
jgi:hypothetical protein